MQASRKMTPGMKFFFSRIFPLIFLISGAVIAFLGIRGLIRAKESSNWPSVKGKIITSSVKTHHSSGKNGSSTTYHAHIIYKFKINGEVFNGERVAYGDYGSSDSSHAWGIVHRYPVRKKVLVHYMPGNPEECLLEPGIKAQAWFMPIFGLVFFTAGTLMAIFMPRAMKKMKA